MTRFEVVRVEVICCVVYAQTEAEAHDLAAAGEVIAKSREVRVRTLGTTKGSMTDDNQPTRDTNDG